MVDFSKQLHGDLNTSTILADMHASINRSEPKKGTLNIGGFIGEHLVQFGVPRAQKG
jgi:hypothetical protein